MGGMKTCLLLLVAASAVASRAADAVVKPTARQLEWADCEIGVIIHQDVQVYRPFDWRKDPLPGAEVFAPTALDTDQWIETAKKAGAKYAVLVAKHGSGFSLWPTKAHAYSVAHSPWKDGQGDVVADFIASCRKYGVRPGLYASTGANAYFGVFDDVGKIDEARWGKYLAMVKTQLTELWTNYGELFEIWFDGGNLPPERGGREIEDLLLRLQPQAVVFQGNPARMSCVRWVGNERAHAPEVCWNRTEAGTGSDGMAERTGELYAGRFDGRYWVPGEADMPNRDQNSGYQGGWMWHAGQDATLYPPEELLERYFTSVGRGCNLLLGMVIDNRGRVPDADVAQFTRFGELVKGLYAKKVAGVSGKGKKFVLQVPKGARPNLLSVQEDLTDGERIRSFTLHGFDGRAWHTLATESNMGHRRLVRFVPGDYERYRLDCWDTRDWVDPVVRDCSLYEVPERDSSTLPLVMTSVPAGSPSNLRPRMRW